MRHDVLYNILYYSCIVVNYLYYSYIIREIASNNIISIVAN